MSYRSVYCAALCTFLCGCVGGCEEAPKAESKGLSALGLEFVWIEQGRFSLGTSEAQEALLRDKGLWLELSEFEQPVREVVIERGFFLSKYEITQAQRAAVTGARPWVERENVEIHPNHPAVYVSWRDVQQFILHLNVMAGTERFRLPTEAEWEYACRAGSDALWSFGDDEKRLGDYAWYRPNAWDAGRQFAQSVGTKAPNKWGLHDMYGNVWEWCQDWAAFPDSAGGYLPILRGGSFFNDAANVRSALRIRNDAGFRFSDIGLRLVREE